MSRGARLLPRHGTARTARRTAAWSTPWSWRAISSWDRTSPTRRRSRPKAASLLASQALYPDVGESATTSSRRGAQHPQADHRDGDQRRDKATWINYGFFTSARIQELKKLSETTSRSWRIPSPASRNGHDRGGPTTFKTLINIVMEQGKQGLTSPALQRLGRNEPGAACGKRR